MLISKYIWKYQHNNTWKYFDSFTQFFIDSQYRNRNSISCYFFKYNNYSYIINYNNMLLTNLDYNHTVIVKKVNK